MPSLFFSYSHADEALRNQLEKHLSALKHQGIIDTWHDRRITAGQDFDQEIDAHLEAADVILLLISSDFLASDYCYKREMNRAMERQAAREATVIPVILRPCDWHDIPFGRLQAAPKNGLAITKWANVDEAFLDVVTAIKGALRSHGARSNPAQAKAPAGKGATTIPVARSSNLRVRKELTEYEKDRFMKDAFEYLANFIESSLTELIQRNPDLDQEFRRIDANRFTALVYKGGKKVCRCSIHIGGMLAGISYSGDENARSNSYNENLSVGADEQDLFFTAQMGAFNTREKKLTFEGAAETYWGLFLQPIQPRD